MESAKQKNKKYLFELFIDYARMIFGTTLIAASITVFYEPNEIITGGFSGLCIVIAAYARQFLGIELALSLLNIALNLPLLIVGYIIMGRTFIWRTLIATFYLSVALEITAYIPVYIGDNFIVAVFGGVVCGLGVGLTFRSLSTTGGSDLLAAIIHKLRKSISIANALFVCEAAVIVTGFLIFGVEKGLYAIVSVFIVSKVVDNILEGLNFSKGAFVISEKSAEIAENIMIGLDRGVTGLSGKGMYSKTPTNVLLCVVANKEILKLKKIVKDVDPNAFLIVTDVKETFGEGFSSH